MARIVPMTADRFDAMNRIDVEAWSDWATKKFGRAIVFPTKQPLYGTYLDGDPEGSFIAVDERRPPRRLHLHAHAGRSRLLRTLRGRAAGAGESRGQGAGRGDRAIHGALRLYHDRPRDHARDRLQSRALLEARLSSVHDDAPAPQGAGPGSERAAGERRGGDPAQRRPARVRARRQRHARIGTGPEQGGRPAAPVSSWRRAHLRGAGRRAWLRAVLYLPRHGRSVSAERRPGRPHPHARDGRGPLWPGRSRAVHPRVRSVRALTRTLDGDGADLRRVLRQPADPVPAGLQGARRLPVAGEARPGRLLPRAASRRRSASTSGPASGSARCTPCPRRARWRRRPRTSRGWV